MKRTYALIVLAIFLFSCNEPKPKDPQKEDSEEFSLPSWAKDAVIYEVNTRQFSEDGNFKGIETQLDRLQKMGIEVLWLMPVHPISELKRKATGDILVKDIKNPEERAQYFGSPYAVADYRKVNPDYGSMDDFKSLLKATHAKGMKLIIDWVPNHTGWDNPWISEHPDWYTKDKDGNITDPINPGTGESWGWTDVADLDYSNKEMRLAMIDAMNFWIKDIGIDGFRVDVAHGITQDFWDECSPVLVNSNPEIFLLAESEVESHRNNNTYHATYGWSFHHLMNEIARGEKNALEIDKWYEEDRKKFKKGFHMHFTSNHDENTWAGTVFDRMGDAHKALAVLSCTFDGFPLLYSGQEEPMRKRLPFFTKEYIGFKDYAYTDFYTQLFTLKKNNQALWNGQYGGELIKLIDHENIYAFQREKNGDAITVIINLSSKRQSFTIPKKIIGNEIFSKQRINWNEETALGLEPWQYYVINQSKARG